MIGTVFSIEEFSIYDGPGIRTTVFLKGCPLRCSWCHNPEGQKLSKEIRINKSGCIKCGNCGNHGVYAGKTCDALPNILGICPNDLISVCGTDYSAEELVGKLLKNEHFLKNGGVTFSGGEPLMQCEFVSECIDLLSGRLHTAVQTSGYCKPEKFEKILKKADLFLFDLKLAFDELHKKYTGVSNKIILENYRTLTHSGKDFITRIPLIPNVTDTDENINGISEIMHMNGVSYAEIMPYNTMAGGKYASVGRVFSPDFDPETPVNIDKCTEIFGKHNIKIKIL